jgi:hypothetical protein
MAPEAQAAKVAGAGAAPNSNSGNGNGNAVAVAAPAPGPGLISRVLALVRASCVCGVIVGGASSCL